MLRSKRVSWVLLALVVLWGALQWALTRPENIADDWMGWRQADTQSIAFNFVRHGFDILHPRINWGGDGPGFVEAEFQLFSAMVGGLLWALGAKSPSEIEWPGQLLSLTFVAIAGLLAFRLLRPRYGGLAAAFGAVTLLTSRNMVFLSTSVQPDAMSFLLYVSGFGAFVTFAEGGERRFLWGAALLTALAGLVKPTALNLGVVEFTLLLFGYRQRLRKPQVWLAWIFVLAINAAYLAYAARIHAQYGNTFGVVSGGDSKFPTAEMLLHPGPYLAAMQNFVLWGIGPLGTAAAVYLLVRREVTAVETSLLFGNILLVVTALRYTSSDFLGSHYHAYACLLGCWLVAHAVASLEELSSGRWERMRRPVLFGAVALLGASYAWAVSDRITRGRDWADSLIVMARDLRSMTEPGDLVVVRSEAKKMVERWGGVNNYEDPRLFYLADVRGWVLAADEYDLEAVRRAHAKGARFYIDPFRDEEEASDFEAALADEMDLVDNSPSGRIYRFK